MPSPILKVLTEQERKDVIEAIEIAQNELQVGPNFPEGSALYDRLEKLLLRLREE